LGWSCRSRDTYLAAGAAASPLVAPGVVSDLEAFLSFFFLSFFFVVPLAPLVSLAPPAADAPDVSLPPEALAPLLLLSDGVVAPIPLVPEEPDAPPALLLSDGEVAPVLLVPEEPDAPPALLLSVPLELLLAPGLVVPDAPDELVSLAPDEAPPELDGLDGLPACADWAPAPALVEESAPALRPAPCASAIEDTDATNTNDNDWIVVFNVMSNS
jgi:hypothetical protein